jgi:hypothetical protein
MKRLPVSRRTPVPHQAEMSPSPSYEGLLDGLPMGVILLNANDVIHTMNAEAARLCGGPAAGYVGKRFPELWQKLTGINPDSTKQRLRQVHHDKQPWQGARVLLRQRPESSTPVEWTCMPAGFDQQLGLAVSLRDVSREQELMHDRNRLA